MKKKFKKILLLDDEEQINFYHTIMLTKSNASDDIIAFESASKALDFIKYDETVDLILLDINMPKINGWGFLTEFEKLDNDKKEAIKIIMLSSSVNDDDKKKADANPYVCKFLRKPLDKDAISQILQQVNL